MKITILNGASEPASFDNYLAQLKSVLEAKGHAVTQLDLRDLSLRYCIGCWGCWVKTPGQCISQDASIEIDRAVINSDFTLWAAPLKMGFPTTLLKMALDKHLPLIHPYMEVVHHEAHHLKRYKHYPRVGVVVEKEIDTDEKDLRILTDILARTALNFKSRLEFLETTDRPVEEVAGKMLEEKKSPHLFGQAQGPTRGVQIAPPQRLTLLNGSPRGRKGNTPIFLREIAAGFGGPSEIHHLNRIRETEWMVQAFADAECVILGFPLYTDAMPGVVKHFIEALEPLSGKLNNPPIGFVVQSGFPEGLHSRYVERFLEKLAERLGSPYIGTVVKGNGEAVRVMPENMTDNLFANLQAIGSQLAAEGCFDPEILEKIARPERFPIILGPLFRIFLRLPIAHSYFDSMLKANGMYERRFDRPFVKQA
jgi:multimeric flavodoxin WrbA